MAITTSSSIKVNPGEHDAVELRWIFLEVDFRIVEAMCQLIEVKSL